MKITKINIWKIPLTSHVKYNMASGKTCDTVNTIIMRIDTNENICGWGEVCPIPHYLPAYANGVIPAIEELAEVMIGENPLGAENLMGKLDAFLIGHQYVKSPVDIALWDITAKKAKMPLYQLLGGKRNELMPLYHSITCIQPDEMAKIAKEEYKKGIRQFQAKLGADNNWEADVERLIKVREAVGEGPLVYGDWNCGATRLEATRVARAVAHGDFMMEQPCDTIEQCAQVKQATGMPMKMDENAHDTESLLKAYELGCMDAVAIKLSKFGGISKARQARDLCVYLGAKMCVEDTWGSDVATAALLHLAASTDERFLLNTCDLSGYVAPRIAEECPVRENGKIMVPQGIGLGVNPDESKMGKPTVVFG